MEIKNIKNAVQLIKSANQEDAEKILSKFEQATVEKTVERAWDKIRGHIRFTATHRKNIVKNHILNYNEDNGAITLRDFSRFYQQWEDLAKKISENGSEDVIEAIDELVIGSRNALGNISLDFRMNYAKDD
jgi:hypothetical protein